MALAITNTFSPATTILSSQVNTNFTDITTWANGNIGADSFATLTGQVTWSVSGTTKGISVTSTGTGVPLELISTTRGMLPPRMTTAQRNAIASPAEGETVFDTDANQLFVYAGTGWEAVGASSWTAFTPTGSWSTNTTYTGFWRRVGDTMEVRVRIALSGAPTSATLTVNCTNGNTIDTAKLLSTNTTVENRLGDGFVLQGTPWNLSVAYSSTTAVGLYWDAQPDFDNVVTQALPNTFSNGHSIQFRASFPIVGWGV
jgi:hypothetical protein